MGSEAQVFLEALFAGKPDALFIQIWTKADKRSYWFQKVDDAIRFVESLNNQDVYVATGISAADHGPFNRCKSDETAGAVGVFVDVDLHSEAHRSATLPRTIEEALSIIPAEFPPSIVIFTGNGIHVWHLFPEPHIFENDEERKRAGALSKRWNTLISDNARMNGWKIDRLGDLARLLRIPGTTNCKDPGNTKKVSIYSSSDRRYNPSDLAEFLDDLGVPDDEEEENTARQWAQQFQEKPLKIDLNATIPQEQLDRWIASDPKFKVTWFRQRSDLKDQTQSGYDLALANFGYRAGLKEQEIVDLMIHHRRIYKQKPRTKLDYFYRTLSKAAQGAQFADQSRPTPKPAPHADTIDAEPQSAAVNPGSEPKPKSAREKIELCKRISVALEVEVLRMVRVSGDQPLFRMDLAEGGVSFPTVAKLISQGSVRTAIAGRVGKLIRSFKQPEWRILAQMMLDACIDEDGGEEMESAGAARLCIRQYLAESPFITEIAGQRSEDLRKPIVRHDQIAVCSSDIQSFLNRTRPQATSVQAVVVMLLAAGAKVERDRGKNYKEQSRWMLPLAEFDPADYESRMQGGSSQYV